nr:PREDICTED: AFG3-like protein 2 [Paralichthys olivaceus]
MAHRYLRLSAACRSMFRLLLPSNAPARLVMCSTTAGQVDSGRSLLTELLGAYRNQSSKPPKGFEKYFPDAQKPVRKSETEAATKGRHY